MELQARCDTYEHSNGGTCIYIYSYGLNIYMKRKGLSLFVCNSFVCFIQCVIGFIFHNWCLFVPAVATLYGNNNIYSPRQYLLSRSVIWWLPLCFMCEIGALGEHIYKKPITQQIYTISPEVVTISFSPSSLCHLLLGDREVIETEVPFLFIYSWISYLIFMPFFSRTIWAQWRICCLGGGKGPKRERKKKKIRFQLRWARWMKGMEREIDGGGMSEQGFMCSLVNEKQALKVTGCVYYWSVRRLMWEEERAELLSRAPSNKLYIRSSSSLQIHSAPAELVTLSQSTAFPVRSFNSSL